jgi:hypothetical protein
MRLSFSQLGGPMGSGNETQAGGPAAQLADIGFAHGPQVLEQGEPTLDPIRLGEAPGHSNKPYLDLNHPEASRRAGIRWPEKKE